MPEGFLLLWRPSLYLIGHGGGGGGGVWHEVLGSASEVSNFLVLPSQHVCKIEPLLKSVHSNSLCSPICVTMVAKLLP